MAELQICNKNESKRGKNLNEQCFNISLIKEPESQNVQGFEVGLGFDQSLYCDDVIINLILLKIQINKINL